MRSLVFYKVVPINGFEDHNLVLLKLLILSLSVRFRACWSKAGKAGVSILLWLLWGLLLAHVEFMNESQVRVTEYLNDNPRSRG